jgi:hypothetical protein
MVEKGKYLWTGESDNGVLNENEEDHQTMHAHLPRLHLQNVRT